MPKRKSSIKNDNEVNSDGHLFKSEARSIDSWDHLFDKLDHARRQLFEECPPEDRVPESKAYRFDQILRHFIELLREPIEREKFAQDALCPSMRTAVTKKLGSHPDRLLTNFDLHNCSEGKVNSRLGHSLTQLRCNAMGIKIPDKALIGPGEVSEILGVEPYVLRYWVSEFKICKPTRTRARKRFYSRKDVEKLANIRYLLYEVNLTMLGVKKQLQREADNLYPPWILNEIRSD